MTITSILRLYFLSFFRSPFFAGTLFKKIIFAFVIIYVGANIGFVVYLFSQSIFSSHTEDYILSLFNSIYLYIFLVLISLRFSLSNYSLKRLSYFYHLPLGNKVLLRFKFFELFFTPEILFIPFVLIIAFIVGISNDVSLFFLLYLFLVILITDIVAHLTMFNLKYWIRDSFIKSLMLILSIAFLWFMSLQWNEGFEQVSTWITAYKLVLFLLLMFSLSIVYFFTQKKLLLKEYVEFDKEATQYKAKFLEKLANFNFSTQILPLVLVQNEIKMLLRTPRGRFIIISSFINLVIFNIIANINLFNSSNMGAPGFIFSNILTIFSYITYLQLVPRLDSTFFDRIHTLPFNFKEYIYGKFLTVYVFSIFSFLSFSYYIWLDFEVFKLLFSVFIFNLGVVPIFYLGFSSRHRSRFDLFGAVFYSNMPNSGVQFMVSLFVFNLGFIFLYSFNWLNINNIGYYLLTFIGVVAIALHRRFSKEFVEEYLENKYKMLEGFNNKV